MLDMRASVIINNYNYGRFLREAIDSALSQTHPTEVIVVDDGSTDDSRDIVASYGDRIFSILKSNGGQGSTYNAGFPVSTGDFVCFLDSDDTLFPDAMEEVASLMSELGVVKVQWPAVVTDADGKSTGRLSTKRVPPEGDLSEMVMCDGPFYDFDLHTGSAYARSMLKRVLPMPEPPYRNGGDVYLITVAPVLGLIRNASKPLGTYRAHGRNNFRDRPIDEARLRNYIQRFEANSTALESVLTGSNKKADPQRWKETNFNYIWPTRLLKAIEDMATIVPLGATVIAVDGNEWGSGPLLPARRVLPFLERNGEYWGPPTDSANAIAELERMRSAGASFIAIWWTVFWWLKEYAGFAEYLRDRFKQVLNGNHLIMFDLRATRN